MTASSRQAAGSSRDAGLGSAVSGAVMHFQRQSSEIRRNIGDNLATLSANVGGVGSSMRLAVQHTMQQAAASVMHDQRGGGHEMGGLLPGFASITTGARHLWQQQPGSIGPQQVVGDLAAYNPLDVQARLAPVPVYTVANKSKEFVLVSGEDGKQLGLFFFNEKDANELIGKMKDTNPKLAKQAEVLTVPLDRVYAYVITPREQTGAEGVVFRFMPDMREVSAALQMFEANGVPQPGFAGVPVFQAGGLSVKGENGRYTPLFLSKEDLDVAVYDAYERRDPQAEQAVRSRVNSLSKELEEAKQELSKAGRGSARKAAQAVVDAAEGKLSSATRRMEEMSTGPTVEVGSLEDVISQMEGDAKGAWGDVMFIPPGALAETRERRLKEAGKKGEGKKGGK